MSNKYQHPKNTPTPEAEQDDWREQEIRNLSRSPEGDAAIAALSLPAAPAAAKEE